MYLQNIVAKILTSNQILNLKNISNWLNPNITDKAHVKSYFLSTKNGRSTNYLENCKSRNVSLKNGFLIIDSLKKERNEAYIYNNSGDYKLLE